MPEFPPGPTGHPLWGTVRKLRQDILGTLLEWVDLYGDAIRFRFFLNFHSYLFCHPDHNRQILQDNFRNYTKLPNPTNAIMLPILGDSLFTSDGDFWMRQRRLAQPAFHRRRIAAFGATMVDATAATLERWQPAAGNGGALDIAEEMMELTLEIAGKTLFSVDLRREAETVGEAFSAVNRQFSQFTSHPFGAYLINLPWLPGTRRFNRNIGRLDQVVYRIIEERRAQRDQGQKGSEDLLDLLMEARDEESGEGMSNEQLRNEVMTLMIAGHETTANALTWTFYLLSLHPEVRQRVEKEVDDVLGGRPPAADDIHNLPYTMMVLRESMRLYPPAYAMARTAQEADVIGGYDVAAGATVTLSPYLTHRHPDFWEDPENFDPERFRPERRSERPPFAYIPFGGGPRECIGNHFALMEAMLVLAMVVQRYHLHLLPGYVVETEPLITLRPRHGLRMLVEKRKARGAPAARH